MNSLSQFIQELSNFGGFLEGLVNVSLLWMLFVTIRDRSFKTVDLSIGSFMVKRKDYNVQNITNLVNLHFYDGGIIPDNIRQEIIQKTAPSIKGLKVKQQTLNIHE